MRNQSYADILRMSVSETTTRLAEDESRLVRALPPIPAQRAKTSGMVIDGQFEMFRGKHGGMVFVGENGQYIVK